MLPRTFNGSPAPAARPAVPSQMAGARAVANTTRAVPSRESRLGLPAGFRSAGAAPEGADVLMVLGAPSLLPARPGELWIGNVSPYTRTSGQDVSLFFRL